MLTALPVNAVLNVRYNMQQGSQAGIWTVSFRVDAVGALGVTVQDIATALDSDLTSGVLQSIQRTDVQTIGTVVNWINITSGRAMEQGIHTTPGTFGTDVGASSPPAAAMLIHKLTGRVGRAFRGRAYFPFVAASNLNSSGIWAAAAVATVQTAITTGGLMSAQTFTVGAFNLHVIPVIVHRSPLPVTTTDISSLETVSPIATQRRRSAFGRPNIPV